MRSNQFITTLVQSIEIASYYMTILFLLHESHFVKITFYQYVEFYMYHITIFYLN